MTLKVFKVPIFRIMTVNEFVDENEKKNSSCYLIKYKIKFKEDLK